MLQGGPCDPDAGAPRPPGGVFAGMAVPAGPLMRALRPAPRPTFSRRESRQRYAKGCALWNPPAGGPPFSRSLTHRAGLPPATNPDRFATLGWWVNRSFFLPKLHRGSHLQLLIRGAAVRFSFWVLPGVAALSGGSGEAAGGMIMPPTGVQGASPLTRLW